jgi:hypothetical protein
MLGMNGTQRLVASTVLGGTASVAGGGTFANGAITGAFGYMFNYCAGHPGNCSVGEAVGAIGDGAYSVLSGAGNSLRLLGRSFGFYGSDEIRRSDQEVNAIARGVEGYGNNGAVRATANLVVKEAAIEYIQDEANVYRMLGRASFGTWTGLGPAAMVGDSHRQAEAGHNWLDSVGGRNYRETEHR